MAECLVLAELYGSAGNMEQKEGILKEAYDISPEDPRLLERASMQPSAEFVAPVSEMAAPGAGIEDYSEDMSEAEFYLRQGLSEEAKAIYHKLLKLFPDNEEIKQKLLSAEVSMPEETAAKEEIIEELAGKPVEEFVAPEALEAHEAPETALENDVLDIFEEFKKGLEKEVGAEDSETHYNLGIAYKEMGLIDDAIREFQVSKNDPKRLAQSINMLGICYMSKGLFSLAIESFSNVLGKIETRDESYWGVKYDLAEAYEKNGDVAEALEFYTGVYGWNSKFRNVSEKINLLKVMVAGASSKPVILEKQKIKKERVSYL